MAVDLRKVKKLIELVEESGIAELEVSSGDESVRIAMNRGGAAAVVTTAPAAVAAPLQDPSTQETVPSAPSSAGAAPTTAATTSITTPMAGTFYRAPHPDAEPFVQPGQKVAAGDVVCIIESMKMNHEIRAATSGTVAGVEIENGQPVSTGDVLFLLS